MYSWIGICGKKRSGKDVIADYLVSNHAFQKKKIAENLKAVVKLLFSFTDQQLEDDTKDIVDARWGISPRTAMQFIGTDIMQFQIQKIMPHIGRNFWMNSFLQTLNTNNKIVISDIRFKHEYEAIKNACRGKFLMIKVERPSLISTVEDTHSSETAFEEIPADITIKNDGTIEDLTNQISRLFDP
jgi:hypothetical protein